MLHTIYIDQQSNRVVRVSPQQNIYRTLFKINGVFSVLRYIREHEKSIQTNCFSFMWYPGHGIVKSPAEIPNEEKERLAKLSNSIHAIEILWRAVSIHVENFSNSFFNNRLEKELVNYEIDRNIQENAESVFNMVSKNVGFSKDALVKTKVLHEEEIYHMKKNLYFSAMEFQKRLEESDEPLDDLINYLREFYLRW
jgi:hypothetical protein